ncbi:MAG: ArsC/Spx/MgsR family protein [Pseudomonadota bacterium]
MTYVLIHNPACSTSRKGLALLEAQGVAPELRKYMNVSERLSEDELRDIAKKLGGVSPREFMRAKDGPALGIDAQASDNEVFAAMAEHPKLIQRPIGIKGARAAVGRPIEQLLEIL